MPNIPSSGSAMTMGAPTRVTSDYTKHGNFGTRIDLPPIRTTLVILASLRPITIALRTMTAAPDYQKTRATGIILTRTGLCGSPTGTTAWIATRTATELVGRHLRTTTDTTGLGADMTTCRRATVTGAGLTASDTTTMRGPCGAWWHRTGLGVAELGRMEARAAVRIVSYPSSHLSGPRALGGEFERDALSSYTQSDSYAKLFLQKI